MNNGSIELQFDFNCDETQYLVIADAHGTLSLDHMKKAIILFDAFIIHSNAESSLQLEETIRFITEENRDKYIISIVHDSKLKKNQDCSEIENRRDFRVRPIKD